jgi:molybdopterin-guanine dinucleotide biosynthesis protein A
MPSGVIVAGGRSTRFGEADKATADLAGVPMIRRVADRLTGVVDALVVNCRDEQTGAIRAAMDGYDLPVRYAVDEEPDRGPMAGVRTGLRAVPDEFAFVAACDMPFLDAAFVAYLFDRVDDYDAAVPRLGEWFQPTHAVYRATAMADACDAALERGESRIVAPLDDLEFVVVGEEEVNAHADRSTFENLNTREEFEAAAERFA